jgi:hypothetical protein
MTSAIVHRHLEASDTRMTPGTTSRLHLGSTVWMTWHRGTGVKVHQDLYLRVSLGFGISVASSSQPQHEKYIIILGFKNWFCDI